MTHRIRFTLMVPEDLTSHIESQCATQERYKDARVVDAITTRIEHCTRDGAGDHHPCTGIEPEYV